MADECQAGRGDEFLVRQSRVIKGVDCRPAPRVDELVGLSMQSGLGRDGPRFSQSNRHLCNAVLFFTFAGLFESHQEPALCCAVLVHERGGFALGEIA
jgi:hypothetical protein